MREIGVSTGVEGDQLGLGTCLSSAGYPGQGSGGVATHHTNAPV